MRDSAPARNGDERPWFARPAYVAGALLLIAVLELLALDGRTFHYLGFSLQAMQAPGVSDRLLIDTLAAMTLNGIGFYALAAALERHGTELQADGRQAALHPVAVRDPAAARVSGPNRRVLARDTTGSIWRSALTIALVSQTRQRRAFYYAGRAQHRPAHCI